MATVTLNIPTAAYNRLEPAICNKYGYSAVLANGSANPQTKPEFVKERIVIILKNEIKEYEGTTASNAALVASNANVDANIVIT